MDYSSEKQKLKQEYQEKKQKLEEEYEQKKKLEKENANAIRIQKNKEKRKRHYEKLKADPIRYAAFLEDKRKRGEEWRNKNPDKKKKQSERYFAKLKFDEDRLKEINNHKKEWEKNHPDKLKEKARRHYQKIKADPIKWKEYQEKGKIYKRRSADKYLFGGNRELVIQRDGEKCQTCGLTREESLKIYKKDITVDHKDRKGKGVSIEEKNNDLDNLITLCIKCHTSKDSFITWKSRRKKLE